MPGEEESERSPLSTERSPWTPRRMTSVRVGGGLPEQRTPGRFGGGEDKAVGSKG